MPLWVTFADGEPVTCPCGSGLIRQELYDARSIFVSFVCAECRDMVKAHFRPDIFTDPNYWTDEPVEEEE